jgi:hypothetical protein
MSENSRKFNDEPFRLVKSRFKLPNLMPSLKSNDAQKGECFPNQAAVLTTMRESLQKETKNTEHS